MIRAKVAIVLMIVPLLIAIAIGYWESSPREGFRDISSVVLARTDLRGASDDQASALAAAIRECCEGKENLRFITEGSADAVLQTTITEDAGLMELELRLVDFRTRKTLW